MSEGIAGHFVIGDGLQQGGVIESSGIAYVSDDPGPELVTLPKGAQVYPTWPFTSEADLRRFIREEVHQALDDLAREIRENKALRSYPLASGVDEESKG